MDPNRRSFLATAGGAALAAFAVAPARGRAAEPPLFVGCGADRAGDYLVAGMGADGEVRFERPLPARGHGLACHPTLPDCAVFARRPGTFIAVLDSATGQFVRTVDAAEGRRFCGHGTFDRRGRLLFAAENDYRAGRGVLGVYDAAAGYRRIGEMPSAGIGPHDVELMPDGATLAVANGGILTHPDQGRAKLNIATMTPNLAYLDAASGRLLELAELPSELHQLSIRHVATNRRGQVAIAMQYEGSRQDRVPLVGVHQRGGEVRLFPAPEPIERRLRHYTGSIAFDSDGEVLAASSPRGHIVTIWNADSGDLLQAVTARDTSGVAATGRAGEFLLAGGDGNLWLADRDGTTTLVSPADGDHHWDNHLVHRPSPSAAPV